VLIATIGAWARAHMYSETFLQTYDIGEVRGLITSPNGLFLFKNSSQNDDPTTLDLPLGFRYYRGDALPGNLYDQHALFTHRGLNGVIAVKEGPFPIPPPTPPVFTSRWSAPGIQMRGCSFRRINCEELVITFWFLVCLLMLLPATTAMRVFVRMLRIKRRSRRGLCLACGYDLRESNERCPECGAAFHPPAAAIK
jgi:hypothetical protein